MKQLLLQVPDMTSQLPLKIMLPNNHRLLHMMQLDFQILNHICQLHILMVFLMDFWFVMVSLSVVLILSGE